MLSPLTIFPEFMTSTGLVLWVRQVCYCLDKELSKPHQALPRIQKPGLGSSCA